MKNKNILISGAGIAGLTLAYWLKKYGFVPTIVEKHPTLRTEGYKLDIRGVAIEVVKQMGLQSAIFDSRTAIQKALFVDSSGKVVTETSPDLCGVRAEGDLEIVRGDLCQILFKQIGDVECLFGDSIKNISQNENGVHVEFARNESRLFDLVVGADGLHSKVRKLGFGEESQFLRELGLYISFYSIPNFLHLDCVEIEYHSPKRFAIAYCPRDGMAKAGFAFSAQPTQFDLHDLSQQQQFLQEAFVGAGWEIPRFLAFMKEAPDFYFDCMAQVHMPHWTNGRIALVGDSGYAVSPLAGQGSSVALIGAYVLAGELAEAQGDYSKAFQEYENCLRDFVKKNQNLSKMSVALMEGNGSSWLTSTIIWLGHYLGRLMPGKLIQFFKKLGLKQTTKAANALKLKEYQKSNFKSSY
jgi:2-polyprenyl-6-methoxyphenol hydroxylase-like FAD-dependent oxidoreductase